ncbi:MAG: hypothetical protein ACOC29_00350, partial [Candidatus Sumerlaeota bacterium]
MTDFPRTEVGGLSLSRLIVGSNWFLGFSHCSEAKSQFIKDHFSDWRLIADVLEVFFNAGVDTVMGHAVWENYRNAITEAEQRTGRKAKFISTPGFPFNRETPAKGFDMDEVKRILDQDLEAGADIVMPHQSVTDAMVDRCTREIRHMPQICAAIRERGLIPGLSTHMPESIIYADETELDVEIYISIYNNMGFLMQVEVDWVSSIIRNAKKPVLTIKPMAAGQVRPFQAFTFVWNTIRPQDMVAAGTMTPNEAREVIELSTAIL